MKPTANRNPATPASVVSTSVRTLLAPRLGLRIVPTLRFEIDRTLEAGMRIEELLREIKDQDEKA